MNYLYLVKVLENEVYFYPKLLCFVLLDLCNFMHSFFKIELGQYLLELTSLDLGKTKNILNVEQQ